MKINTSLLAECEVRTASYGLSCFPSFYGPSAKRAGHENKEGKKRGSITCHTDQANEAKKMICLLYGFVDYSTKRTKSFYVLTSDQEQEVRTATYGPEIDQSQRAKSVGHIIRKLSHTAIYPQ